MLNGKSLRELAYVVRVNAIEPIPGKDRVECAKVLGWTCMVRKGQFKEGDLAIYFEIDSKLDVNKPEFAFTDKYHGKIKTQKFALKDENGNKVGQFWSQGLLMAAEDFGWQLIEKNCGLVIVDDEGKEYVDCEKTTENCWLTEKLGVTYADPEDNKRKNGKVNKDAKYQRMMNRHPKLAKSKFGRWCMKHEWAKKLLYIILGGDKKNAARKFPEWVKITDEDRYQSIPQALYDEYCKEEFWASEKLDGSSETFTMKGFGKDRQYLVCSRQVVKDVKDPKGGYYEENIWAEMHEKYNMQHVCESILDNTDNLEFITLQGEVYGKKVQKREYGLDGRDLAIFNVIFGFKDGTTKRLNPAEGVEFMKEYGVPFVPVLGKMKLPSDRNELQAICAGKSMIDGGMREGIVFRSDDGTKSFKAVDNEFLLKYHG